MNSRQKGKRVELAAAKFLRSIGFPSARRGQQFRGGNGSPDVVVEELPGIHFEVKGVEGIDIGTKALADAYEQAKRDCAAPTYNHTREDSALSPCDECERGDREPVVLWKRNRAGWRLTYLGRSPHCLVTVPEGDIRHACLWLQRNTEGGME